MDMEVVIFLVILVVLLPFIGSNEGVVRRMSKVSQKFQQDLDELREREYLRRQRKRVKNRKDERYKNISVQDTVYVVYENSSNPIIVEMIITDVKHRADKLVDVYGYSDSDYEIDYHCPYEMGIEVFLSKDEAEQELNERIISV